MSRERYSNERHAADGRHPWWANEPVRLTGLLLCLGCLLLYLLSARTDVLGQGSGAAASIPTGVWAPGCPARGAPSVSDTSAGYAVKLREDVRTLIFGQRQLYRQGTVEAANAWSDEFPRPGIASLPKMARVPAAYEMRWWLLDHDDLVADVFVFHRSEEAQAFFRRAASARCRAESRELPASEPPGARNLLWRNPDQVMQADVYLVRGRRVYRVADVPPQRHGLAVPDRRRVLATVDGVACALPGAGC